MAHLNAPIRKSSFKNAFSLKLYPVSLASSDADLMHLWS